LKISKKVYDKFKYLKYIPVFESILSQIKESNKNSIKFDKSTSIEASSHVVSFLDTLTKLEIMKKYNTKYFLDKASFINDTGGEL